MRPHLHSVLCACPGTAPVPLDRYEPADPERFGVAVQAFIGPSSDGPVDLFDFVACTPRWFADAYEATGAWRPRDASSPLRGDVAARHLLHGAQAELADERAPIILGAGLVFMRRWDAPALATTLEELCAQIEGADWGVVAARLGRVLPWEFASRHDQRFP